MLILANVGGMQLGTCYLLPNVARWGMRTKPLMGLERATCHYFYRWLFKTHLSASFSESLPRTRLYPSWRAFSTRKIDRYRSGRLILCRWTAMEEALELCLRCRMTQPVWLRWIFTFASTELVVAVEKYIYKGLKNGCFDNFCKFTCSNIEGN